MQRTSKKSKSTTKKPTATHSRKYRVAIECLSQNWNRHLSASKTAQQRKERPRIRRGGLYLADLARVPGSSKEFLVPVLVLQTDQLNKRGFPSAIVAQCTPQAAPNNFLRVPVPLGIIDGDNEYSCMIDAIRALNSVRFRKQLGQLPAKTVRKIVRHVHDLISR